MIDLGMQGAKRQSWRDFNYRVLANRIFDGNYGLSRSELQKLFVDEINKPENHQFHESAVIYAFDNCYEARLKELSKQRPLSRALINEEVEAEIRLMRERIPAAIYLEMMIGDKKLRDLTGRECAGLGAQFTSIAAVVAPDQIVGDILTDEQLKQLTEPALSRL